MPNDPFFNRIVLQLIQPPASSRQALELSARGSPKRIPPEAEFPVESARSWVKELLKDSYHPRDEISFLPFPEENGLCDVVRAVYKAGGYEIEIAQSRYLISIKLRGINPSPEMQDEQKAEASARLLFTMGDRIRFARLGAFREGSYGKQDVGRAGRVDAQWPHWLDTMRWWYVTNEIGFITLKASGGPTKAVISPSEDINRHWFK